MATVTKTIGSSGRDYTTIASWEADLDSGAAGYSAADDAVGELYADSDFGISATMTIDGGGTIGLNSVKLTVPSAERHDGTANTGVRLLYSAAGHIAINTPSGFDNKYTFEWFEIDKNGNGEEGFITNSSQFTNVPVIRNCIIHGASGDDAFNGAIYASSRDVLAMNNIIYDWDRNGGTDTKGIFADNDRTSGGLFNNTVYGVTNATANSVGIKLSTNSANGANKNNIAMGCDVDFEFAGTNNDSDYNMSSDTTASGGGGSNNLVSKTASSQFVSITGGSEDLHLKTGADAIDAGVDLVTTPTNVNIDINGRDRDSNGDTWDIGAHEFVAAGGGSTILPMINAYYG